MTRIAWAALATRIGWLALAALPIGACAARDVKPCGIIPEGGCPLGRGGTCDDAACSAIYNCLDGAWTLFETCEGGPGSGGGGAGQGGGGAGGCVPATIDHSGETTGCMPDLQEPDCPAAVVETCNPCTTGCVDFFLCREEGWESVAFCDEEGNVIIEP